MQVNYYFTENQFIVKSFCQLAEKSLQSFNKTLVVTNDHEMMTILDKALWTYSKSKFVPHATFEDPMPEAQPILLYDASNISQISNVFNHAVFVNIDINNMHSLIVKVSEMNKITKISLISETDGAFISKEQLKNMLDQSKLKDCDINFYKQLKANKWISE